MSERFFSSRPITTDRATLDGPEAHHLLHVMRASAGDELTLFDGSGAEFIAVVESLHRAHVDIRIIERRQFDRELPFPLVVGVALPKGDRQKWLVEKLTELGITAFVPLITERAVAQPTASALDRLGRSVIEAAKQCGRNRLMQIVKPQAWEEWIAGDCGFGAQSAVRGSTELAEVSPQSEIEIRRLLAHPGGLPLSAIDLGELAPAHIAIGPEGGLADAEVAAATAAGWQTVSLGPRTLRIETAAIALAAAITVR
jgi:16S rRNA (uracil1498-N3)-methyltransferase